MRGAQYPAAPLLPLVHRGHGRRIGRRRWLPRRRPRVRGRLPRALHDARGLVARLRAREDLDSRGARAVASVGGLSHPLLDGLMHADVRPFMPWSDSNPFLGLVGLARAPPRLCCRGALRQRLPEGLEASRFTQEAALERRARSFAEEDLRRVYRPTVLGQPMEAHDKARVGAGRRDLDSRRTRSSATLADHGIGAVARTVATTTAARPGSGLRGCRGPLTHAGSASMATESMAVRNRGAPPCRRGAPRTSARLSGAESCRSPALRGSLPPSP